MIKIRSFGSLENLISEAESVLREYLQQPGGMMLSGGSTPYVIYDRLIKKPCPVHAEKKLFLSDERMVPINSPDNNFNNLKPMLEALKCTDQFLRVKTEYSAQDAALDFETSLKKANSINLGLLGLGSDGHTAGLFTKQQALITNDLTLHTSRPDGMQGVSVTPTLLSKVQKILLIVTGESKRKVITTLRDHPEKTVAGIILQNHADVILWTDLTF